MCIKNYMQSWCQQPNFGFYDNWSLFKDQHPLEGDGICPTKQSEGMFASEIELVRKALN